MADGLHFSGATINSATKSGQSDFVDPTVAASTGNVGQAPRMPDGTSFLEDVLRAKANKSLSVEGEKFIDTVKKALAEKNITLEVLPRTNCYMFRRDNVAIGLMFEEHMVPQRDLTPRTRYLQEAYREIDEKYNKIVIPANVILVCPIDYDNTKKWIEYIDRAIMFGLNGSASFDVNQITNGNIFRVVTAKHAVVLPYYQYGVVLEVFKDTHRKPNQFGNDPRFQDDTNWEPILVVPMYTTFVAKDAYRFDTLKFIPQVHISEPLCLFPNIKMLPLIQSLAVQYAIVGNMWKDYFNQYDSKSPNIGALWFEDDGTPSFVKDVREREQFIYMHCASPVLVMDVQNGRATIPGLSLLSIDTQQKTFLEQFAEFFQSPNFRDFNRVVAAPYIEYTGTVSIGGDLIDSREFEYFKILPACNNQRDILEKFITVNYTPDAKLQALANMNYSVQSLYDTAICVLDPEVVLEITNAFGSRANIVNQGTGSTNYIDFSPIDYASRRLGEGISQANGGFFTMGSNNRNGYSPFTNQGLIRAWNR